MGLLSGALGLRSVEDPSTPLDWNGLASLIGARPTASGVTVSPETAMRISTVFTCVRVLGETVGALNWHLFDRRPDGGKDRAEGDPLYSRIRYEPNPEMTSQELRETLTTHLALRGMAYCEKELDGAGNVVNLWPLRPDKIRLKRHPINGGLGYDVTLPSGQVLWLPGYRVWRVRGFGTDPLTGLSPIGEAREAFAMALALEEYQARYFLNDSRPGGVLKTDKRLSDESAARVQKSWTEAHAGLSNAHRVAVLEEGLTWQQVGLSNSDAQFMELRKYTRSELIAMFRLPAHKAGDLEHATFSNIEHQQIEFYDAVLPYCLRLENTAHRDLLPEARKHRQFVKHNMAGLVRGDFRTRMQGYALGRQWGWWSVDEIRENEDLNPLPDGQGKIYMEPLNMRPAGTQAGDEEGDDGKTDAAARG